MPLVTNNGRALHYMERGRGDTLVLLHGLGSSGADWALQMPPLEERFRVIVPDLPGSGHSAPLAGACTIAGLAQAVWSLLDHLGAGPVNLAGFSLGGAVALEMAVQRPQAVRRLALINSLANYRLNHWRKLLEALLPMVLVPLLGMRFAARLAAKRLFPMPWQRSLRERAIAVLGEVPAQAYFRTGCALIGWTASERLHRLQSEVLVIAAEHDLTPLAEKSRLAERLGAHLVIVRGSRHGTPFDAVQATNAALLALLTDQPLPRAAHLHCDGVREVGELPIRGSIAEEHALAAALSAPRAEGMRAALYDPSAPVAG